MKNDLSDNQRRTICRVLFLLACALPTLITVYFATHQRTPDQWAQLLQAELGVDTSIGVVETPRPGEMLFHHVKLYDNNGKSIFESPLTRVTLGNTNRIEFRNPIQLTRKGLGHFLEEAAERLVKPRTNAKPWEVVFESVEVLSQRKTEHEFDSFNIRQLYVGWQNSRDGRTVSLEIPLNGNSFDRADDRGRMLISKDQRTGEFNVAFNTTNNGSVPCWLARSWFPELEKKLGPLAEFSGVATIESQGTSTTCELTGSFKNIQLPAIPGVEPTVARKAKSISVNGVRFEDSQWMNGIAQIKFDDHQTVELPNPLMYQPRLQQQSDVFAEAIRFALRDGLRDDFNTTFLR